MGAAESALGLPHRVNLVYGGRHALAKLGRGDCPAGVVAAHTLLSSPRRRSHGDHKWLLEGAGAEHGEDGSATRCVVRSDHHPQRFLCARGAVELVSGARDESRLWEIEYLHDHPLRTDAVKPPFRLRSLGKPGRPYLVVDADLGGVALQSERPATLWEFFDAAGSTASLQVTFARSLSGSLCRDESPVRRAPSAVAEAWQLKQVSGSLEDVLSAQPDTQDGARAYSAPEVLFSIGEALCNASEIAQPPSTLYGVYLALLGQDSSFRRRLCDGANPEVAEVQRLQEQPGCGIAGAKCVASIPVLGKRTYQESLRVALCRDGAVSTLAIQVAGTLKIGFPVGDFLTETLHLFTQAGDAAPVCLQSWGMAQPGAQQRKALDGMRGKQLEYLANVRRAVEEAPPGALVARAPPAGGAAPAEDGRRPPPPGAEAEPCGAASPTSAASGQRGPGGRRRAWSALRGCLAGGCAAGILHRASPPEGPPEAVRIAPAS